MTHTEKETLDILRFELKFLEDGGYGRSPRTPWRPSFVFIDSPTCLNFNDASRSNACDGCCLCNSYLRGVGRSPYPVGQFR